MAGRVWTASESQRPNWNSVQQAAAIKGWEGPAIEEAQSIEEQDTWNKKVGLAINISWDPPLTDNSSKGNTEDLARCCPKGNCFPWKWRKCTLCGFGKVLDKSLHRLLAACLVGLSARICTAETPQTKCTMHLLSKQSQPNSQLETKGYDGKFVIYI